MKTQVLDANQIDIAAAILKNGGVVGIPTETVYGLAADALNGAAVAKIFEAKGRPMDNPLIVHIADFADIRRFGLVEEIPESAEKLAKAFWPGPLTMIMKRTDAVPHEVSAGLDTVAIRFPSHPVSVSRVIRWRRRSSERQTHRWRRRRRTSPVHPAPPRRGMCSMTWTAGSTRCWTAAPARSA